MIRTRIREQIKGGGMEKWVMEADGVERWMFWEPR